MNKPFISRRGAGTKKLKQTRINPISTASYTRKPVDRTSPRGHKPKYPWDEWMDGATWLIKEGEDFSISTASMLRSLHVRAWRHGYFVETGCWPDGVHIVFRFYTGRKQVRRLRSQFHSDI